MVLNESLTLNGLGPTGLGALANASGSNNWAGPLTLGSPTPNGSAVAIGAGGGGSLTISSAINDGTGQTFGFTKADAGTLILNNSNTYVGATAVAVGIAAIIVPAPGTTRPHSPGSSASLLVATNRAPPMIARVAPASFA